MSTARLTALDVLYERPGPRTRRAVRLATALSVAVLLSAAAWVVWRLQAAGQFEWRHWHFFARPSTWLFIAEGVAGTLAASLLAGAMALGLGLLLMAGRVSSSGTARAACTALIELTRGVPTLLFIYLFILVIPRSGLTLPAVWNITLPVAISASGTVAELLRSGVNAVPAGQREAALALGMSSRQAFWRIILPQGLRSVIPALIAELVIVLKDTTFAYLVSFPDLMQNARVLISNYDALLPVYLVVAMLYIAVNYLLNLAALRSRALSAVLHLGRSRPS